MQQTCFPSLMVSVCFWQCPVCYASASVLQNPECPLILSDCPRPVHLSPWLWRCQLFCDPPGGKATEGSGLPSPSRPLFIYFQDTSVCFPFTDVVPFVSVCLARLYGQCLIVSVSGSFMLIPFPLITLTEANCTGSHTAQCGSFVLWG